VKARLIAIALAVLGLTLFAVAGAAAHAQQQPAVPDAPAPQPAKPLADVPITPGLGAGDQQNPSTSTSGTADQQPAPSTQAPAAEGKDTVQTTPPETLSAEETATRLVLNTTYVEVPVTVKDNKGKLVAGLTARDFRVYENNTREPIRIFNVVPFPLSIAFVVDQSLTADVMAKVNTSLDAIQGALTPYDELAVFTYSNGAQNRSGGFTGAQSARVPFVLRGLPAPPKRQLHGPQRSRRPLGRQQRWRHYDSKGDSHPQRRDPRRGQRAFNPPQGPPPHHLRHLGRP